MGFRKIVEELRVKNKACVYVGDNLAKDFIAPNRLGFRTIQLMRPNKLHSIPAPNADAKPEFVLKSIGVLPSLLEKL